MMMLKDKEYLKNQIILVKVQHKTNLDWIKIDLNMERIQILAS